MECYRCEVRCQWWERCGNKGGSGLEIMVGEVW